VAICTNDVALFELSEEAIPRDRARSPRDPERLLIAVAVIEVHRVRRESATAVLARHVTETAHEFHRVALTRPDALEFLAPMRLVVRDVVRPLISWLRHKEQLEQVFMPCQ